MYAFSFLPALFALYWAFGNTIVPGCISAALTVPLLWVATTLGLATGSWLGRDRLRTVTIALLLAVGVAGMMAPWLRVHGGDLIAAVAVGTRQSVAVFGNRQESPA